jgi:hypothetical protein
MKVEESVSGALLGLLGALGASSLGFCSTFGLEVNSEDMIWTGWRCFGGAGAAGGRWESFRGRLVGRSSSATLAFVWEGFRVRALCFSTLFDWSLRMVKYIICCINTATHLSVHRPPFFAAPFLVDGPSSSSRFNTKASLMELKHDGLSADGSLGASHVVVITKSQRVTGLVCNDIEQAGPSIACTAVVTTVEQSYVTAAESPRRVCRRINQPRF